MFDDARDRDSDESVDSGDSHATFKDDQRLQSTTIQHLDMMLGYSEVHEFRRRMNVNQHREKLWQLRQKLQQSIYEKETFLRVVHQALAKDRADLDATIKEIEDLDDVERSNPSVLDGFLEDQSPSSSTPRYEDEDEDSFAGKDMCSRSQRTSRLSPIGSAKTMPDLPLMIETVRHSTTQKDLPLHSRAIMSHSVAHGERQRHCVKAWRHCPAAAVSMPDLPMMSVNLKDSANNKACQSKDEDLSDGMSLWDLAHRIPQQLPAAVKTMPVLPGLVDTGPNDFQSHSVSAGNRHQAAARTMPDLPMMYDHLDDSSNGKDDGEAVSSSMDLCCLAHRIRRQLPGAVKTMPDLPDYAEEMQNHRSATWHRPPGAAVSMPDLPMISEDESSGKECPLQEDGEDTSSNMDLSCLAEKICHQPPGAAMSMPALPMMNPIVESSDAGEDAPSSLLTPSRATGTLEDRQQSHCIRAWQRPPGAAITMPDLPMMSEEFEDEDDNEDCLRSIEQESRQDLQVAVLPSLPALGRGEQEGQLQGKMLTGISGGLGAHFPWSYASRLRQVLSVQSLSGDKSPFRHPRALQREIDEGPGRP